MAPKTAQEKYQESIKRWRFDLNLWVSDFYPDITFTTQQKNLLDLVGRLYRAKYKRYWIAQGKDWTLSDEDKELASKIGISVMSGHQCGKDFIAAILHNHFLWCFQYPRVLCTANTFKQLKNVLHSAIVKSFRIAKAVDPAKPEYTHMHNQMEINSEKIFMKGAKDEWFSEFVTANVRGTEEEQGECLAGRNADYKLTIVDEASGIPPAIFKPFEGAVSGIINVMLMIGNPTRSTGYFVDSHGKNRDRWAAVRWNAEDSEITNKDAIKDLENKYGRDSNTFRIRVLGLPPLAGNDVLIPPDWIDDACNREFAPDPNDPVLCGVDCGGGGDKSVHCTRRGGTVFPFKRNNSPNTKEIGQWVANCSLSVNADKTFVEMDGLGRGVFFEAQSFIGGKVMPVQVGGGAVKNETYVNKRAECYFNLREAFESGTISLKMVADDQDFIDQLLALRKEINIKGLLQIIGRKQIVAEIGHSPDEATALAMTYALPDGLFRSAKESREIDIYDFEPQQPSRGWMGA